jgi:hypothetical protein
MRQACSHLIEKCSLAAMPFHNHPIIGKLEYSFNVFGLFYHFAIWLISADGLVFINHEMASSGKKQ